MEDKIKVLKEKLVQLHYDCYKFDGELADYDVSFDVGFIQCASLFLTDEELEQCKDIAWNRYMADEGYTQEQADEIKSQAIENLKAGIGYLQENPNAKLSDVVQEDL